MACAPELFVSDADDEGDEDDDSVDDNIDDNEDAPAAGKVLSKSGLAEAIATETGVKKKVCLTVLHSLATVATAQVKSVGKVTIPGLFMVKKREKPATKAGKREVFGKVVCVKSKPAQTVVKAYCVAALKKSI